MILSYILYNVMILRAIIITPPPLYLYTILVSFKIKIFCRKYENYVREVGPTIYYGPPPHSAIGPKLVPKNCNSNESNFLFFFRLNS